MKAIVAQAFAPLDQLGYVEWPEPQANAATVVIQTEAIGVNYPDGLLVQGLHQVKPTLPFVPGMEVAGTVFAVGPEVKSVKPGDRVMALTSLGAYAEKVAVAENTVTKMPDGTPGEGACALMCTYGAPHHALKQRAGLKRGETLCVLGASSSTGFAAIQIGKMMGARVIGVDKLEEKRLPVDEADIVLGYDNLKEELNRVTDGKGVDVAFDTVGGEAFDAMTHSMAWGGRLLVVGFSSGTIPHFSVNLALVKGFSVIGVFWGAFIRNEPETSAANMQELIGWYNAGGVNPVIEEVYPLAEAANALKRVLGGTTHGKLILKP